MTTVDSYVPNKGDLIWLDFSPQAGHEQRGRRPALVVSNRKFNRVTGMCVACPITNTYRRHPFRLALPATANLTGYLMVDQIKSLDFKARNAQYQSHLERLVLVDVLGLIDAIIFQD